MTGIVKPLRKSGYSAEDVRESKSAIILAVILDSYCAQAASNRGSLGIDASWSSSCVQMYHIVVIPGQVDGSIESSWIRRDATWRVGGWCTGAAVCLRSRA